MSPNTLKALAGMVWMVVGVLLMFAGPILYGAVGLLISLGGLVLAAVAFGVMADATLEDLKRWWRE